VRLDDLPGQHETEPGPGYPALSTDVSAEELREDPILVIRRDTEPGVVDQDQRIGSDEFR
jgi:hypothetical protein